MSRKTFIFGFLGSAAGLFGWMVPLALALYDAGDSGEAGFVLVLFVTCIVASLVLCTRTLARGHLEQRAVHRSATYLMVLGLVAAITLRIVCGPAPGLPGSWRRNLDVLPIAAAGVWVLYAFLSRHITSAADDRSSRTPPFG